MGKARELLVGDELEATSPEETQTAGLPATIRVCAFDNGRVLVRDVARDDEVTSTLPLTLDDVYVHYNVHALLPVTDEEVGWRRLGAKYAERVKLRKQKAAEREAELRSPEQVFAEVAAAERKSKANADTGS